MKTSFLVTAAAAAAAVLLPLSATAATVNLGQWAYGDSWGNVIDVSNPGHVGAAGGFKGAVAFAAGGELGFSGVLNNFITYCVEIDETFTLPSGNLSGYSVVGGSSYAKWSDNNGDGRSSTAVANRLGQLLSYVASDASLVDTKSESTSLQLAIWNVIYDNDDSVAGGAFSERSASGFGGYADKLMAASESWSGLFDVYVLARAGSQDFLLTKNSGRSVTLGMPGVEGFASVPEPATLALGVLALGAAGVATRRRRGA